MSGLPNGKVREALRQCGQFWTPDWVADAMVAYVLKSGASVLFDPAVGAGAFFHAAKRLSNSVSLVGAELDPAVLDEASRSGLTESDLSQIKIADFVLDPPAGPFKAIAANPPYIRHHRLSSEVKTRLRQIAEQITGLRIDGRAGLHIYFLLRALQLLDNGGRLAFIMPADTCEGVFAGPLWKWITKNYRLDAVVTFSPEATPFPGVDTNVLIFMIRRTSPSSSFHWLRCSEPGSDGLMDAVAEDFSCSTAGIEVHKRDLKEALTTGLSRSPLNEPLDGIRLGELAHVMRGIATGANEFFFLTGKQVKEHGIPEEFLIRAVGRTRDVPGDCITDETLNNLEAAGRPTYLLVPDGRNIDDFPSSLRSYLMHGEEAGIHKHYIVAVRQPWYKMETRLVPPFLFAYTARLNGRFILNKAGVVPLTGFLCVYLNDRNRIGVDRLWRILNHPDMLTNIETVGKSYGRGAVKVEPRALERLIIPEHVLDQAGYE